MSTNHEQKNVFRECLYTALMELMTKKPLEKMGIGELCSKAGVSRLTYYRNSRSKEDILAQHLTECYDRFVNSLRNEENLNLDKICLEYFTFVKEEKDFFIRLVNSRLGNGFFDYISAGDNVIPEDEQETLFESPVTLNHSWGYKPTDTDYKSAEEIAALLARLRTQKVNLLLNVGPDPLGRFPAAATQVLENL